MQTPKKEGMAEPAVGDVSRLPCTATETSTTTEDCHSLLRQQQIVPGNMAGDCDEAQGAVVHLTDGAMVRVRPARSDDEEQLRSMFLGLSTQTRYLYFCAGVPANETWAERFAALGRADGETTFALVAEAEDASSGCGTVIGLARFVRGGEGNAANVGILLADNWQSRGLGRIMLARVRSEALRRAISIFTGTMLWENRRMLRLAKRVFPQVILNCSQGVCDLTIALG